MTGYNPKNERVKKQYEEALLQGRRRDAGRMDALYGNISGPAGDLATAENPDFRKSGDENTGFYLFNFSIYVIIKNRCSNE